MFIPTPDAESGSTAAAVRAAAEVLVRSTTPSSRDDADYIFDTASSVKRGFTYSESGMSTNFAVIVIIVCVVVFGVIVGCCCCCRNARNKKHRLPQPLPTLNPSAGTTGVPTATNNTTGPTPHQPAATYAYGSGYGAGYQSTFPEADAGLAGDKPPAYDEVGLVRPPPARVA